MKLDRKRGDVSVEGTATPAGFRIAVSAKAFDILSDLYSDKPLAIIRELGCNARDSHCAAGKAGKPIEVRLPTLDEPTLSIRDEGVGISPEQIEAVYTVYFASDKTGSNDYVGALGLGSKSPFCYTQSFTVISRHGGVARTYSAFKNEAGVPDYALMGEADAAGEPSGVEVIIPVPADDHHRFRLAAVSAFEFFDTRPNVLGGQPLAYPASAYTLRSPEFGLLSLNKRYSYTSSSRAIMGGISYPLDAKILCGDGRMELLGSGVHLFLNIGDVDVVPSREALSYTDATTAKLKAALDAVRSRAVSLICDDIDACDSLWEARQAVLRSQSVYSFLVTTFPTAFRWRGHEVTPHVDLYKAIAIRWNDAYGRRRNSDDGWRRGDCDKIVASSNLLLVVLSDTASGAYAGAIRWMEARCRPTPGVLALVLPGDTPQSVIDAAGFGHLVVKASELPKAVRPPREKAPKLKVGGHLVHIWGHGGVSLDTASEVDVDGSGLFVETCRGHIVWKCGNICDAAHAFEELGGRTKLPVLGVKTADIRKLGPGWVRLEDRMAAAVAAADAEMLPQLRLRATLDVVQSGLVGRTRTLLDRSFARGSVYGDYLKRLRALKSAANVDPVRLRGYEYLAKQGRRLEGVADPKFVDAQLAVVTCYPLLSNLWFGCVRNEYSDSGSKEVENGVTVADVKRYIDLIDRDAAARGLRLSAPGDAAGDADEADPDAGTPDAQAVA